MKTAPKTPPPQHISASELRQNLAHVLQEVEDGESFVVEKYGEPVARITASNRPGKTFEEIMAQAAPLHRSLTAKEREDYLRIIRERQTSE